MDVLNLIDSVAENYPWAIYLLVFASPFIQEDSAVIGTAALTAIGKLALGPALVAIFLGLFFSDIWKYWIGWFARKNNTGERFSKREQILSLESKVHAYPFTTLIGARFIPFTRIPCYLACGFFRYPYPHYCGYIALTAAIYITLFFGAFHLVGELMAEQLKWMLPIVGVAFVLLMIIIQVLRQKYKTE